MKILHLVLYSKSDYYDKMKTITSDFYTNYNINVDTYYYYFNNTITDDYELKDNELKIKGVETFIPGILDKTIKAFKYFQNKIDDYDYVIRSNISTVINFDKIFDILSKNNYDYGFYLFVRPTYKLASGTSILLSNKTMHFIYNNMEKINYKTIDDTAIGLIIFKNIKKVKFCNIIDKVCFNYTNQPIDKYVIFRNKKKNNRFKDVEAIKKITSAIIKAKNDNIQRENIQREIINEIIIKKNLKKTNVRKTNFIRTNIIKTNFKKINIIKKINIKNKNSEKENKENIERANTEKENIEKENIEKENIERAKFRKVKIKKTDIKKTDIKKTNIKKTTFLQINKKL